VRRGTGRGVMLAGGTEARAGTTYGGYDAEWEERGGTGEQGGPRGEEGIGGEEDIAVKGRSGERAGSRLQMSRGSRRHGLRTGRWWHAKHGGPGKAGRGKAGEGTGDGGAGQGHGRGRRGGGEGRPGRRRRGGEGGGAS